MTLTTLLWVKGHAETVNLWSLFASPVSSSSSAPVYHPPLSHSSPLIALMVNQIKQLIWYWKTFMYDNEATKDPQSLSNRYLVF